MNLLLYPLVSGIGYLPVFSDTSKNGRVHELCKYSDPENTSKLDVQFPRNIHISNIMILGVCDMFSLLS